MTSRRGEYGVDAPYVPAFFGVGVVACLVLAGLASRHARTSWLVAAALFGLQAASYLYTTRRGKLVVWDGLLAGLKLRGNEKLLDVGCGRGAVLLLAAQRLPNGRATGVDLWSTTDQSGNAEATTRANAALEGVTERVELCTGDMRALPFPDASFDVVTSSAAIHNVSSAAERARAVAEIARVLVPGGTAILVDFRHVAEYARTLAEHDLETKQIGLGWRGWYGGPHAAMSGVIARKR